MKKNYRLAVSALLLPLSFHSFADVEITHNQYLEGMVLSQGFNTVPYAQYNYNLIENSGLQRNILPLLSKWSSMESAQSITEVGLGEGQSAAFAFSHGQASAYQFFHLGDRTSVEIAPYQYYELSYAYQSSGSCANGQIAAKVFLYDESQSLIYSSPELKRNIQATCDTQESIWQLATLPIQLPASEVAIPKYVNVVIAADNQSEASNVLLTDVGFRVVKNSGSLSLNTKGIFYSGEQTPSYVSQQAYANAEMTQHVSTTVTLEHKNHRYEFVLPSLKSGLQIPDLAGLNTVAHQQQSINAPYMSVSESAILFAISNMSMMDEQELAIEVCPAEVVQVDSYSVLESSCFNINQLESVEKNHINGQDLTIYKVPTTALSWSKLIRGDKQSLVLRIERSQNSQNDTSVFHFLDSSQLYFNAHRTGIFYQ